MGTVCSDPIGWRLLSPAPSLPSRKADLFLHFWNMCQIFLFVLPEKGVPRWHSWWGVQILVLAQVVILRE